MMKVEVFDEDFGKDDLVGEGTVNLAQLFNNPNRTENCKHLFTQNMLTLSAMERAQVEYYFRWSIRDKQWEEIMAGGNLSRAIGDNRQIMDGDNPNKATGHSKRTMDGVNLLKTVTGVNLLKTAIGANLPTMDGVNNRLKLAIGANRGIKAL